jgi:hypothetical protein
MSLGGMLDAKWAHETQVYCGGFCNAQGSLQFLGETSVSLWTLAITLHTMWSVVSAQRLAFRPVFCFGVVAAVWIYVFAFNFVALVSVSPVNDEDPMNFFTPTPFCEYYTYMPFISGFLIITRRVLDQPCSQGQAIRGVYPVSTLPLLPHSASLTFSSLWLAGAGNIFVYIPLFLLLRGHIVLGNNGIRSLRFHWTSPSRAPSPDSASSLSAADDGEENIRKDAYKMLWYPAAYTILVLPLSVVRWMRFSNADFADPQLPGMTPLATATLIFHALFRLSGVVNVGLVLTTRPNVLLFGESSRDDDDEEEFQRQPANGRRGDDNAGIHMRQRGNAAQPTEQLPANRTGFGGVAVSLDRDEDEK